PGLLLRIVGRGDPELATELQAKANDAGKPNLLELAGFVERTQLPSFLASADVFVAPSIYEGGPGFVYLEAMACGLPVIACDGSGIDEIITPGENGMLVPPKNVKALEGVLRKLLSDNEALEVMGRKARKYVIKEADGKSCIKK